jgi:hypothetical protein
MRIVSTLTGSSDCPQGFDCPHVHLTETGELVAQGYVVTDALLLARLGLRAGQTAVRMPAWMPARHGLVVAHERAEWAVVVGPAVTDGEMLEQMEMDRRPDEAVVRPSRERVLR